MKKALLMVSMLLLVILHSYASAAAPEKELRIGYSGPMSGQGAAWGLPMYQGIVMHAEEINATGSLTIGGEKYKIKVCGEDNKYETAAGVSALEKLLNVDKVHVMYTFGGPPLLATQANLEKIPMLNFILVWDARPRGSKYPYTYSVDMIPMTSL